MNKTVLIGGLLATLGLVTILGAGFGKDPHRIDSPLVGKMAPPFELAPVSGGERLSLEKLKGKPALVNFWATWCEPCKAEHALLQQAARALQGRIQFVGIVYDDEDERIEAFLGRHGSGYPALVDRGGKAAIAYGVYGVPETYFLDASGKVLAKHEGPLDAARLAEYVRLMLEAP